MRYNELPDACIICGETRHRHSKLGKTTTRFFDCGLEYDPRRGEWDFFPATSHRQAEVGIIHLHHLVEARGGKFAEYALDVTGFVHPIEDEA